jgi:chromosome segregation ATPase
MITRERDSLKLRLTLTEDRSKQQEKELTDLTQQLLALQKQYHELSIDIQGIHVSLLSANTHSFCFD